MSTEAPTQESLATTPAGSRWGWSAARVYLAVVAVAFGFTLRDLAAGHSGIGTWAISVLTAPWSVLLTSAARALAVQLSPQALRVAGLALVVVSAALNARILYGIAARAERDAADSRAAHAAQPPGGPTHG